MNDATIGAPNSRSGFASAPVVMKTFRIVLVVFTLTVLLSVPRFGHHTPDSPRYVELANYLHGDFPRDKLLAPYAYRVLVPFIAGQMPFSDLDVNFALLNVLATIVAYLCFLPYLRKFVGSRTDLNVGMLALVVSFPTFNYASGVLTDPVGFLFMILASYLLLEQRYYSLTLLVSLGILARESMITMVLASVIYVLLDFWHQTEKRWIRTCLTLAVVFIPPVAVFFGAKAYFFDLRNVLFWGFSPGQFFYNMSNPVAWTTLLLTLLPPLLLFLLGVRRGGLARFHALGGRQRRVLVALSIAGTTYVLYSMGCCYMSGRFVWPFYAALIPLAVLAGSETSLYRDILGPMANWIFGSDHEVRTGAQVPSS